MATLTNADALDRLLDPVRDCLTRDVALKIIGLRADPETQARLDGLAERNAAGTITPEELAVYDALIGAGNVIAVLQAKARAVIDSEA